MLSLILVCCLATTLLCYFSITVLLGRKITFNCYFFYLAVPVTATYKLL